MSRKRDTNWTRDEITVLLDSIMEITKTRAADGKRTNSKEVFEYAAKKMGERGHSSRAEREKCRTKWKKMKEEFTHAKRAREGDSRYKEAPGIQPFYDRMEEFINGNFDNISPHSTIVRRTSSLTHHRSSGPAGMRTSARLAASSTNGTTASNDTTDTSSTIVIKPSNGVECLSSLHSSANASPSSRQNYRLSSSSNNTTSNNPLANNNSATNESGSNGNNTNTYSTSLNNTTLSAGSTNGQQQAIPSSGTEANIYTIYSTHLSSSNNTTNTSTSTTSAANDVIAGSNVEHQLGLPSAEQADISYRVSTGCRQITIFGDHDVDIKFRGDCVTINKIDVEFPVTET